MAESLHRILVQPVPDIEILNFSSSAVSMLNEVRLQVGWFGLKGKPSQNMDFGFSFGLQKVAMLLQRDS